MNRTQSLAMWERIANGDLEEEQYDSVDPWRWIRGVAKKVIEADSKSNPNHRNTAIIMAVGLTGKRDPYAKLRVLIEEHTTFSPIGDDGKEITRPVAQIVSVIVEDARRRRLLERNYVDDDKKAKDLIRDILHQKI